MLNVSWNKDLMSKPFAVKFAHDNPPLASIGKS